MRCLVPLYYLFGWLSSKLFYDFLSIPTFSQRQCRLLPPFQSTRSPKIMSWMKLCHVRVKGLLTCQGQRRRSHLAGRYVTSAAPREDAFMRCVTDGVSLEIYHIDCLINSPFNRIVESNFTNRKAME
ncbi:hypothetical protein TNCV_3844311 [Trichonephila clavipes]|nr:hypothetical protein TNCV_3844311 [Trichonephila clavipes]